MQKKIGAGLLVLFGASLKPPLPPRHVCSADRPAEPVRVPERLGIRDARGASGQPWQNAVIASEGAHLPDRTGEVGRDGFRTLLCEEALT